MTSNQNHQKGIHPDMRMQASEKGQVASIGRVVGLKHQRFIRLRKQGVLDGKRRSIPLGWGGSVDGHSVDGNLVRLGRTARSVRHGWLGRAGLQVGLRAEVGKVEVGAEATVPFRSGKSGG
jgi:hypothetical protein